MRVRIFLSLQKINKMEKEKIIEGNKLIADFMGYEYIPWNNCDDFKPGFWLRGLSKSQRQYISKLPVKPFLCRNATQLAYNSSWNWIMPVLEKIESLTDDGYKYDVVIGFKTYCGITRSKNMMRDAERWESSHTVNEPGKIYTWKPTTKIQAIWIAVVKFLKWRDEQGKVAESIIAASC